MSNCWRCNCPLSLNKMPYCKKCIDQEALTVFMPNRVQKLYSIAQFNRDLDAAIGHHNLPLAIAESKFRLMFGDKSKRPVAVFVSIKGEVIVEL